MGIEKTVDLTVSTNRLLMLLVLFCLYSSCECTTESGQKSCTKDSCIQTCYEDDCDNLCHSNVKKCTQESYGRAKSSTVTCQASELCVQLCFDGKCQLSCDQSGKCAQRCYGEHCTATCYDWTGDCEQQCITGNCSMMCKTPICSQECHVDDCKATCVHGVDECTQVCYVDKCDFSCFAKKCNTIDLSGEKNTLSLNDKIMVASGGVLVILIIVIIGLLVKYRRQNKCDQEAPLLDQQEPEDEDVDTDGGAQPNNENNVPSNPNENFEHTSQRCGVDSAGYSIPFVDNEEYTIPNSGRPNIREREIDDIRRVDETWPQNTVSVVENSARGDETVSEPEMDVSSKESKKSSECSGGDHYNNGAVKNDSVIDDIVLVNVLPSSDQKLDERRQSEVGKAAKILAENSRLQPNDSEHKDGNSSDDVELVYIEPITDDPQQATCSQRKTDQESATRAKFDEESNIASPDHGGLSQGIGGRQGHDAANSEGNLPGYQALDQNKREIEEKSRYQKLIKSKVV